ncbi:MAG: C10 family peptidase [Treponema sp.]|nr:C10 family peptidase [Treponema sp.]
MKLKYSFLGFLLIFVLIFFGGNLYAQEAGDIEDSPLEGEEVSIVPDDDELASLLTAAPNPGAIVGPLLQTKWGQGHPYSSMSPVNCVVIATAQVMKYHNYPRRGIGRNEPFTFRGAAIPSVNFNIDYDWNNMLNSYRRDGRNSTELQRNAVATFVYHVRAALQPGLRWPRAVVTFFGYDRSIQQLFRRYYNDAEWEAIIRDQLDNGLPVAYSGNGNASHAFVIDGYDNAGRFHINWGWGGRSDGWYSLNALNPGNYNFNNNNDMLINFKPNAGGVYQNHEFGLTSFTVNKTSVSQNENFTVSVRMQNINVLEAFPGGQIAIALVNNSGSITAVIGTTNYKAMNSRVYRNSTINSFVPDTVAPGQYQLRMVFRLADGEWNIVTRSDLNSNIPNAIPFTVTAERGHPGGGYGLALTVFTVDKTTVSQNERFTATVRTRNRGEERWGGGQTGAALVDNNGNITAIVGTRNIGSIRVGYTNANPLEINCVVPDTLRPGQYQLRIVIRPTGGEWRIATLAENVPTSIDFTVR